MGGGVREIPLSKGRVALVDAADFDWLSQWKWHFGHAYAERSQKVGAIKRTIYMHREIMRTPDGMFTDHISGAKLDNRRANLRVGSWTENLRNVGKPRSNTSGYKGVYRRVRSWGVRFQAHICVDYRKLHLGYHDTPEDAARAYDAAALIHHGEFARLNFPTYAGAR